MARAAFGMNVLAEARYRVFGSASFQGNPVTLFELDTLDDGESLQRAAQRSGTEDNVFYTAIDGAPLRARFFSSTAELWLCGHGLLALSHHLRPRHTRAVLSTFGSWQICADAEGPGALLPALHGIEIEDPAHWMHQALRSIGMQPQRLHQFPNEVWVAVLRDQAQLLEMNAATVAALPCDEYRPGALIAAVPLQEAAYGFRYFAPWHGKPEDSGTGSAHCYLAQLLPLTSAPQTALQFSKKGVAEMRVYLRDNEVAVSGRVEPCA